MRATLGQVSLDYSVHAKPQHFSWGLWLPQGKILGPELNGREHMAGGMRSCSWGRTHLENALQKHLTTIIPNGPTNSSRTQSISESATGGQPAGPTLKFSQQAESQADLYKRRGLWAASPPSFSPSESPSLVFPTVTPPGLASWDFFSQARGLFQSRWPTWRFSQVECYCLKELDF